MPGKLALALAVTLLMSAHPYGCADNTSNSSVTSTEPIESPDTQTLPDTHSAAPKDSVDPDSISDAPNVAPPCDEETPCASGVCIEGPTGSSCVDDCADACPSGWTCQINGNMGICLPPESLPAPLCRPCLEDSECQSVDPLSICLDYGQAGRFCATGCEDNAECPDNFACAPITENDETLSFCIRVTDTCPCDETAIAQSLSTQCEAETPSGSCTGVRICTNDGLTPCNVGIEEICDEVDNDCDGEVDEGLLECVPDEEADKDEDGFTTLQGDCNDDDPTISPIAPDLCDGINNDCDEEVDEEGNGATCSIANRFGQCEGIEFCENGAITCDGPTPNECGTCTNLPENYNQSCGCGGKIGCDGSCVGDQGSACTPTSCFVGSSGTSGVVGCPELCTECPDIPWRICSCSSGPGEPTLAVSPANLTPGGAFVVAAWTPTALESPVLRVNTTCIGPPVNPPCQDVDNCGGEAIVWSSSTTLLQIGTNVIEVFENPNQVECDALPDNPVMKAFVAMQL